ncbi:hypothetical protein ACFL5Y_02285 [Candidatus Omnitrophota bacterium]
MYKKSVIIFLMVLLFTCAQLCEGFADEKLVADLETGTLGSLKVGQSYGGETLGAAIGAEADSVDLDPFGELDFYKFFSQGILIIASGEFYILDIIIYPKEAKRHPDVVFKAFKGEFRPSIPKNASKETITAIFGEPDEIDDSEGLISFTYNRSYGQLGLVFDENNQLAMVDIYGGDE